MTGNRRALPRLAWPALLLALGLLVTRLALAQTGPGPAETMLAANRQYEAGRYAEAITGYEALRESGVEHGDLYFNLGNAYFKQGDLGRAILNYRRAHRLNPRDPDIAANLDFARAQRQDQFDAPPEGLLVRSIQTLENWLTLSEAALLALILWWLLVFLAALAIVLPRWRRSLRPALALVAFLLALGLVSNGNRLYRDWRSPPAVVVAGAVDVTSGPGSRQQYLLEFELHAGTEVRLLETRPGWRRVALPGDLQGWVPVDAVEPVGD